MMNKLRIGVALDDSKISDWKCTLLQKVIADGLGTLEVFILPEETKKKSPLLPELWKWHLKIDAWKFKPRPDAFLLKNVEQELKDIPWVNLKDPISLEPYELDVILWLSEEPISDFVCEGLRIGVLYFLNGESKQTHEDFLGYWEFMKFKGVITSALLLKRSSKEKLLSRTWSMMPTLSVSRGRNEHMWKMPSLVLRTLKEIQQNGVLEFINTVNLKEDFQTSSSGRGKEHATFWTAALNMKRHFCRMAFKLLKKTFYREQWILLINSKQGAAIDFSKFKKLLPPKDRFWADPFLIENNKKQYLFIEELPFKTNKGHLSVMEIGKDGTVSEPITILDKPYHLSYPFIFKVEGKHYMIPESYEDKNIQLYECASFPYKWEHKMNLMTNLSAFDTTLYFYNGKWWMFSLIAEQKGAGHNDELFLFFSDTPFTTDWKSHPQNPVVSDVRSARPAGNIYEKDGKLIRPSQHCGKKYGYGFKLNEIEVLTETEYREKSILNVFPDWDKTLTRTHSFNHLPGLTVIDAVTQRSRFF